MMTATYASIALAVLKIFNIMLQFGQRQNLITEGQNQVISKELAQIVKIAGYAKQTLEELLGHSDSDLRDQLRNLEPKSDNNSK